ncbi:MAG TPA: HD domain-containing phosphohydrolase [Candidatus Acidoferrales bacterium]|nr:HD domain-containing phosphohydrolase [Candidatus Acidoferrales bacterium]
MNEKILIVDDETATCAGLELLLRRQGYEIRMTDEGDKALEECTAFQPDLILLDVMMPGRDGYEICREIKSRPEMRLIPIVLITGLSEKTDRIRGIEAGADDFLSKPIDVSELNARVRSLLRLKSFTDELENAEAVLFALALGIEARDPYTHGHCARLSELSSGMGERMALSAEEITALRRAGIVHDVGKVVVPDAILLKPGPLTAEERSVMKEHPAAGEKICAPLKAFRTVLPIIRHHHERWDGSGYPDGLKGEAIPLTARILQVVDVYDALTTNRPYRSAVSPEEAWRILRAEVERGWWDGHLVEEFRAMMRSNEQALQTAKNGELATAVAKQAAKSAGAR